MLLSWDYGLNVSGPGYQWMVILELAFSGFSADHEILYLRLGHCKQEESNMVVHHVRSATLNLRKTDYIVHLTVGQCCNLCRLEQMLPKNMMLPKVAFGSCLLAVFILLIEKWMTTIKTSLLTLPGLCRSLHDRLSRVCPQSQIQRKSRPQFVTLRIALPMCWHFKLDWYKLFLASKVSPISSTRWCLLSSFISGGLFHQLWFIRLGQLVAQISVCFLLPFCSGVLKIVSFFRGILQWRVCSKPIFI